MSCFNEMCYIGEIYSKNDAELNKLHTKQLISALRRLRYCEEYDYMSNEDKAKCDEMHKVTVSKIKAILANREHVRNKLESKAARKLLIKQGK